MLRLALKLSLSTQNNACLLPPVEEAVGGDQQQLSTLALDSAIPGDGDGGNNLIAAASPPLPVEEGPLMHRSQVGHTLLIIGEKIKFAARRLLPSRVR